MKNLIITVYCASPLGSVEEIDPNSINYIKANLQHLSGLVARFSKELLDTVSLRLISATKELFYAAVGFAICAALLHKSREGFIS